MALIDRGSSPEAVPPFARGVIRPRSPRYVSEFEGEIRQLYVRMIDEPIPPRLMDVLRAGLAGSKS